MSISAGWLVFVVDFFELHICFVNSALISHMVCKYFIPFYRLSFVSFLVSFAVQRFNSWLRKIFWRRDRLPSPVFLGFPCGFFSSKEPVCSVGDLGSIPGLGRSVGKWKGYPLLYSGLENSMDCIVHGVAKSRTRLSNFNFTMVVLFLVF